MTKDEIIRMAQEAGWKDLRNYDSEMNEFLVMGDFKDLERFAALIASAERNRILDICKEGLWDAEGIRYHLDKQARGQA